MGLDAWPPEFLKISHEAWFIANTTTGHFFGLNDKFDQLAHGLGEGNVIVGTMLLKDFIGLRMIGRFEQTHSFEACLNSSGGRPFQLRVAISRREKTDDLTCCIQDITSLHTSLHLCKGLLATLHGQDADFNSILNFGFRVDALSGL